MVSPPLPFQTTWLVLFDVFDAQATREVTLSH